MKRSIFTLILLAMFCVSRAASAAVILSEGFNQATIPAGWSLSNAAPVTFVTTSSSPAATPYEGTHFVKFASFDDDGVRSQLVSPSMSTVGKTNITVTFAWYRDTGYASNWDRVYVQYSTDGATWTDVAVYPRTNTVNGWTVPVCALPAAASNQPNLKIAFQFVSAYGNNCYLDLVQVQGTVPGEIVVNPPTSFSATAASKTLINLAWQANAAGDAVMIASNGVSTFGVPSNGMSYAVGSALPGGGVVVYKGNGLVYPCDNLTPETRYYYSAWSVGVTTQYSGSASANATTDFTLPIVQGFNSATVPDGWSVSNTTRLTFVTTSTAPTAVPYEGTHFVKFNSYSASAGTRASVTSPRFSSQGGLAAVFVEFAWHQDPGYPTDNDSMTVEWSSNGTTWVAVQTFTRYSSIAGWTEQRVQLPAAALGHLRMQVRFNFLSAFGMNSYLDYARIIGAVPSVYLTPGTQSGAGLPTSTVAYPLSLQNLTGGNRDVNLGYLSAWPVNGPAATGVLINNGTTNFMVELQVSANAIDGQVCTTEVRAITADNLFTNMATLITRCTWSVQPLPCELFETGLGDWTNYFSGGVNSGWYWDDYNYAAAHDQETGGTNWFVSPALNIDYAWLDRLTLSFNFGLQDPLLTPEAAYLVTGNRNPNLGTAVRLADLIYLPGYYMPNEVDLLACVTNVPVYIAFGYVSANPWQLLTGICVDGEKSGIDNAILLGPPTLPTITSYGSTLAVTGGMYYAGQTGTNGPAALTTAELGFGPTGTVPNSATWTWFPAAYLGASGDYDIFTAAPQVTIAGPLNYCYRFRRGAAVWVYADLDGSTNGFNLNKAGAITVNMLPPQGALLYNQTIGLDWSFGPFSFADPSNAPPRYFETADNISLPYDAHIKSVRMGGLYSSVRQGLEAGFWLRIYDNAVTKPGALLQEQYVPGYACEQLIGVDGSGYNDYKYQVNLVPPFLAQAGNTYWISLQQETRNGTDWSLLDTPDPARGFDACQRIAAAGVWLPIGDGGMDLGMEVYGAVTNAGFVAGTVRNADTLLPIEAAQITITNASYINGVVTVSNGTYVTPAPAGTYHITVTKAGYLPATAAGVTVAVGQTNTQDFLLEGSQLYVTPTNITRSMAVGAVTTNLLTLTNSGPLAVDFTLDIGNFATGGLTRLRSISLPPCDGNFPRGTAPLSLGRAPKAVGRAVATTSMAPLAAAVKGYAFNIFPASPNALISFMTDAPSGYTTIGPANTGSSGFVCGAAFIGGDFSQLYALVYNDNKLVKVNTTTAVVTDIAACTPGTGENWTGMAVDPTTGILYASANGTVSKLYTLDRTTGTSTLVGEITNGGITIGIAINAAGQMYGLDLVGDVLISIDKATGAGTVIGSTGYDANYAQDLAFDLDNNVLYVAAYNNVSSLGELRVADTTTGNTTLIGAFSTTDLEVDGFATMTSSAKQWAQVTTSAGTVAAGGIGTVEVIFDSNIVSNNGTYTAELEISGTHVNPLAPVPLKMILGAGPVISAPASLNFGEVVVGETCGVNMVVGNIGVGLLTGETTVPPPFGVMGAAGYSIPAGASVTQNLVFTPPLELAYTNTAVLTGGGGATVTLLGVGIPEPAFALGLLGLALLARRRA